MTRTSGQIMIDAPAEETWATLADLALVQQYSPGVAKAYYTSEEQGGVGAARHCDLQNPSGWVEERVTKWDEGRAMTIEIVESNAPFKRAFAHLSLTPVGEGTTVDFSIDYELKYGPIGVLMDVLIVRSQFRKSVESLLAGLKHYVETGEPVESELPETAVA